MKITFIIPAMGKKPGKKYLKSWKMEPIMIAVLKAQTPDSIETDFFDDRIELIDYDHDTDIIAISVETYTAKRAYHIASEFKKRGKTIIMGGYHPTLCTEEVMRYADITVTGNAGSVWPEVIQDLQSGTHKNLYQGNTSFNYTLPDRTIYADKKSKYMNLGLVEIGRGCFHNCDFCSIHAYYKQTYTHRTVEDIVNEIKSLDYKFYFLVDDSIFSDKEFAKELFKEIAKLKIYWFTQVTIDIAKDEELLRLMKKAGCLVILIGFESLNTLNLAQMSKSWNESENELITLINRIHKQGIGIYSSFVFGFDNDTKEDILKTVAFAKKMGFMTSAFNHLLLLPGTKTYNDFKKKDLLLSDAWWMEEDYTFGTNLFNPKSITKEELTEYCYIAKRRFFSFPSMFKRSFQMMIRSKRIIPVLLFWYQNLVLHFDTINRHQIPIGKNLDELPK